VACERTAPPANGNGNYNGEDNEDDQRRGRMDQRLKQVTVLERKGRDPIPPDDVSMELTANEQTAHFTFPRVTDAITQEDKEVTFVVSRLGAATLKARFSLKNMMYKDQLAQ